MTTIKNENEISRTPLPDVTGGFLVQRPKGNAMEILKEVIVSSGEIADSENDSVTVETITITRTIQKFEV